MISSARVAKRARAAAALGFAAAMAAGCGTTSTSNVTVPAATSSSSAAAAASSPASPPATPGGPAECATASLRVAAGQGGAAAGTAYTNLDFTNTSSTTCFLVGYPGVSLVSAGSNAGSQIGADAKRDATVPSRVITLAPGATAHAVLAVVDAFNFPPDKCQPVKAHWLKVFPPDQTSAAYIAFSTETCASTSLPTMRIQRIQSGA
jgi:hypothetical protein